jgi:hypothetical protein
MLKDRPRKEEYVFLREARVPRKILASFQGMLIVPPEAFRKAIRCPDLAEIMTDTILTNTSLIRPELSEYTCQVQNSKAGYAIACLSRDPLIWRVHALWVDQIMS